MRSDIVVRPCFIDNAERLLFSYQSVYAEARIYTRRFGCKKLNYERKFIRNKEIYANFEHILF